MTINRWRVHSVLLVTVALTLTGVSIVNVALPSIRHSLGASDFDLQWVLAGYALSFGITLIPAGRLGDQIGRPRLYLAGAAVFVAASVAAGTAADISMLNLARLVQGVGSGLLMPQVLGMIQQYFHGAERARALGAYGTVVAVSMGAAPLLGGLIIDSVGSDDGWRWTFFVNVPVGALAIVLAMLWFPRPFAVNRSGDRPRRIDVDPLGTVLLGLAVGLVLLPITSPVGGFVWGLLPLGLLVGFAWVRWERRYKRAGRRPMVDLAIFTGEGFSFGIVIASLYFIGATAVWIVTALYVQLGLGLSALEAGALGLPSAILGALSARWAGKRVLRLGRRIVSAGIAIAIIALGSTIVVLQLSALGHVNVWWLALTLAPIGIAQGTVISPNQVLTLSSVPTDYAGSSGGLLQTGQRIGSAVGAAAIPAILFSVQPVAGWATAASVALAGVIVAFTLAGGFSLIDQILRRREIRTVRVPGLVG